MVPSTIGNYTVVVSNDFGSVTTQPLTCGGRHPDQPHRAIDQYGYEPGTFTMGSPTNEAGRGWKVTRPSIRSP